MAAVSDNAQKYPFYLGYFSIENKKVRYSLYAASVLAVAAASMHYGSTKVGFILGTAGLFAQGYQIVQIAKEIKNNTLDAETKNQKLSRITDRVFTLSLICGIVLGGLNLSLLHHEGSLLLQQTNLNLLQTPTAIPYAWLTTARELIYHSNNLASIGCFAIPLMLRSIYYGDDFFFGKKENANQIHALCGKLLNVWKETTHPSLPRLFIDMLHAAEISSKLSTFAGEASPQAALLWQAFKNFLAMLLAQKISCKALYEWITSFSNADPNKLFKQAQKYNESKWEKTKYAANTIFFHTLNLSLMAAGVYHHRFPTAIYFALGLIYPTSFQKETTIRRTWEVAPDFIGMPIVLKCRYLFERLSIANTALAWWNIPGACLNGLYLAESFRFYGRRFCQ